MAIDRRGIDPHLARLRRYARAMAGNQSSGDAYVSALLEIVQAEPAILQTMSTPALGLFKLLSQLVAATCQTEKMGGPADLWQAFKLDTLPERIRQALLLVSVERFTVSETAEIMGVEAVEVEALIDAAGQSLDSFGGAEVMIVESEPLIAMNIEQIVKDLGLRVSSMPPTHAQAVTLLHRGRPDLIVADGGCHRGTVDELYIGSFPPVVFISAFPEMLLTGIRPEPVFLARKPFDPPEIKALIYQALFFATAE